jgi:proteasome lid subunit RPN8/RPN11
LPCSLCALAHPSTSGPPLRTRESGIRRERPERTGGAPGEARRERSHDRAELAVELARKIVRDHGQLSLASGDPEASQRAEPRRDSRHRPIAYQVVSIGTADQSLVHPREVFQPGLLCGSVALLVAHSHPSGDPSPSAQDREVTRRLADAGKLLGVALLDHVIFTADGAFHSFARSAPELMR